MTFWTHVIAGSSVWLALTVFNVIPVEESYLMCTGMFIGSVLPDIDNPNSFMGHAVRRTATPKKKWRKTARQAVKSANFDHRNSITHWPSFWAWISIFAYLLCTRYPEWSLLFIGFIAGVFLHLFADFFNIYGIMLLAPISKKRFRMAKIPSGSYQEYKFLLPFVLLTMGPAIIYLALNQS